MSIANARGRLLFRVDPLPGESPRGYLCRVAETHSYGGPLLLAQLAGLPLSGLEREEDIGQFSYVLRLEPEEWRTMCYRHVKGRNRFHQRMFYGEKISRDDLNYRHPRICPDCLRERPVWWAVWDLGLVTACPRHRCLLIGRCPSCQRGLAWQRPAVCRCRCGHDLCSINADTAARDLVAINAAIYRAAGMTPDKAAELDLGDCGFPAEMLELKLGSLLRLILFVGSIKEQNGLRRTQRPFAATDLTAATEIDHAAAGVLRDWPWPLRETLTSMLPPETNNLSALNFSAIFGNFYRHLFRVLPRHEFGFLHDLFETFVIDEWKGLIRVQHRYFSAAVRRNSQWLTVNEAEKVAHTTGGRIWDLIHTGQVDGRFLSTPRGRSHIECWIRRETLDRWIADRNAELARYLQRPEAKRILGLTNATIVKVATAGAIRYVKGPEQGFPTGCFFFLREDVMQIKRAFEKRATPVSAYSDPGEIVALRYGMKNYLGRGSGLADVIRAVVSGSLVPAGYAPQFRGITGCLFLSEDLRRYRPMPDVRVPPCEAFLNYREAACVLGVKRSVIRGLVVQGVLSTMIGYRNGFSKLIPAQEVQCFMEQYVSTTILAKCFNVRNAALAKLLKNTGIPLLAVSVPEPGRGPALFILKEKLPASMQLAKGNCTR